MTQQACLCYQGNTIGWQRAAQCQHNRLGAACHVDICAAIWQLFMQRCVTYCHVVPSVSMCPATCSAYTRQVQCVHLCADDNATGGTTKALSQSCLSYVLHRAALLVV